MLARRLLSEPACHDAPRRGLAAMSFVRAVSLGKGRQCPLSALRLPREVPNDPGLARADVLKELVRVSSCRSGPRSRAYAAASLRRRRPGLRARVPGVEPTQVAALSAATLAVARRATLTTGCGTFREAVARGNDGYLAVYAAGDTAIVAVIGTSSLNVGCCSTGRARSSTGSRRTPARSERGRARPAGERRLREDQPLAAQAQARFFVLARACAVHPVPRRSSSG